jgi:glyoxylase-like metal-dependent hydrolase (beta-lactamase superfamily II)
MVLRRFVVGPIETNCYLVVCEETSKACIVDPDLRKDKEKHLILDELGKHKEELKCIINTHSHSDHTGGNAFLKKSTGAELLIHEGDAQWLETPWELFREQAKKEGKSPCPACGYGVCAINIREDRGGAIVICDSCGFSFEFISSPPADRFLNDGDVLQVGTLNMGIIHTPGHSRGGISIYLEKENILFSGDTLFNRSIGRTDLPGSSFESISSSLRKLMKLPDETVVYPGHGERTTIGEEKRENPYLA